MTPLRRIISEIVADLLALRVMRAHVAAPDPTVPPGDRHSRKVDLWALALRRARALPNRPEWDGQAASLLIAGTSRTGVVRLADGVDA